jgi:hypothetical protein
MQNHEQPPPPPTGQKCAQIISVVLASCNFQRLSASYTIGLNELELPLYKILHGH